ncbi:MAG: methionyl-tRNA formyltransferase [Caldisericia bacterium]|nr:methionyl-tRNA formyltransferase [Caldisericia bacterium]
MKIVFFGSGSFALPILAHLHKMLDIALVVTRPDSARDRGKKVKRSLVAQFCDDNAIKVIQPETVNSSEAVEEIKSSGCDMAVLASYSEILSPEVVGCFKKGIVNVHPSLLPLYRGAEPIRWPIRRGETETGSTMMLVSSGLDRGNIISQKKMPIEPNDSYGSLTSKLVELSNSMLTDALKEVEKGYLGQQQSQEKTFYARKMKPTDEIVDFSNDAEKVSCHIRSMDPEPGVYCLLGGKRFKLFKASVVEGDGKPGEILETGKTIVVACGHGAVEVGEVQMEGSKRMEAKVFLQSGKIKVGDFLNCVDLLGLKK